jgi:DNA (cytosine-5)-methyltransferase 1
MKVVDLFSGAGGLSCGLEMAGFEPQFACEIVPEFAKTYKHNRPKVPVYVNDVRGLDGKTILEETGLARGELELLAGGPPCQGFSINAPIRSLEDDRNQLVTDFIRIAGSLMPRFLLIENVTGIVSFGNGLVVDEIYRLLKKIGYDVHHAFLFAGHYGVPQIRFRTIFLASRDGKLPDFPMATHNADAYANFSGARKLLFEPLPIERFMLKPATTVEDAISDLPSIIPGRMNGPVQYKSAALSEYQRILRNGDSSVRNHHTGRLADVNLERLKHIPQGGSWRDIPHELLPAGLKRARRSDHTKRYGRLDPEGQCSTILTKCDPHWGCFFHPYEDRTISVREAARFQSFPDHFEFLGGMTEQYKQVGNAVPPLLAKAIGEAIVEVAK